METIVKVIGIAIVVIAIVYLLKPGVQKWMLQFFKQGKRLYFAALIRFALAVVFLLAATQCNKPKVIGALGILFIISGLLIFIVGLKKIKSMLEWYQKQSVLLLRLITLILLAIGGIIIYSA